MSCYMNLRDVITHVPPHNNSDKSTSIGGSWVEFTRFPKKKNIVICYSNDPVSPRSFRMNPSCHCSAGSTPRGGLLLVNLFIYFFKKKNKIKNNSNKIIKNSNYEPQPWVH